ncbi:Amidohydrolase 2 [Penicillium riverlandense]|uniref:Amidohydrolase 2 n=1 Tax=Penicillium riverlandense TaxID=1903569 RepID=UPI0025489211|nr:Amidohydrolase 2 [Penicillium riverlandense]KAJ5820564.1 Amidohydrolase 2 [Penicillium riverlandense]
MLTSVQTKPTLLTGHPCISLVAPSLNQHEQRRPTHPSTAPLRQRIPPHSWDSHMHVVEPQRFPVSPAAVYQPSAYTLTDALAFESALGIQNMVLVQPSIYGTDNSCLMDALMKIGPEGGRGIVVVDPTIVPAETLDEWHTLGVRGLRVNLQSIGRVMDKVELERTLTQHADIARPRNWIVEVYLPLNMIPFLEQIVPCLGIRICIDHFGSPELSSVLRYQDSTPFDPYTLPGFASLISLLRAGHTYIKVSAPYRLSKDRRLHDLLVMAREFLHVAPGRVIYATDWPHTRFTGVDIGPFTECCLQLCAGKPGLAEMLFRRNTEEMLGMVTV